MATWIVAVVTLLASEIGGIFGADGVNWLKAGGVYLWPSVIVTVSYSAYQTREPVIQSPKRSFVGMLIGVPPAVERKPLKFMA